MKKLFIIVAVLVAVFSPGCKCKKSITAGERLAANIAAGWESFESANYADALIEFSDAMDIDSTSGEARTGFGWSLLRTNGADLNNVLAILNIDATDDLVHQTDAWTAKATSHLLLSQYPPADSVAKLVLDTDTNYVFVHDPSVQWRDLLITRGQALYHMSDYDSAWQVILPLVNEDTVYTNIDPDSTSWTLALGTQPYTIFAEVLGIVLTALAEINR